MPDISPDYLVAIHQLLVVNFSEEEIKSLCFGLGVEYADLPASGRDYKARELVSLLNRQGRLLELKAKILSERPNVTWPSNFGALPGTSHNYLKSIDQLASLLDMMGEVAKEQSKLQRVPQSNSLPMNMSLQTPIDVSRINQNGLMLMQIFGSMDKTDFTSLEEDLRSTALNTAVSLWMNHENAWLGIDWAERAMRGVVGLVDNPYKSERFPLVVDFRRGHAVIFGGPGCGKTTFLRTLVTTLATTHSPAELHVYILDFGWEQMNVLRDLPHVGEIIATDEEEKITRLLRRLEQELNRREKILSNTSHNDLYEYNSANPTLAIPAKLVIIDNFDEFRADFDEDLMPLLISLVRKSSAYGIHFATSAESPRSLGSKLYRLFNERMTLKLSNPTEYAGIVGPVAEPIDDIPGRGFVKHNRRAVEFQTALPVGLPNDGPELDETQKLSILVQAMQEFGRSIPKEDRPSPINTLANRVLLKNILPAPPLCTPETRRRIKPILGIDDLTLEPWLFDMPMQGPHCFIIGPPRSGKTTTMRSLALSLAHCYTPDEVFLVLVDFQRRLFNYGGRRSLGELPHVADVVTGSEQLKTFTANLEAECKTLTDERKRPIYILIDNYDSFSEDATRQRQILPALAKLAREYGTDGLYFVAAGPARITRAPEELRKQLLMSRFSLALQSVDMVQALNGRVPRGLAQAELPIGRGFAVRSGRTTVLQIATPYDDEKIESILDQWVTVVCERYPGQKNQWTNPVDTADEIVAFARYELKTKRGMSDSLLNMMSNVDVLNMAVEMKLITISSDEELS